MNRRECLEMLAAGGAICALPARGKEVAPVAVVHDSRFSESRAFAAGAAWVLDCREDAAHLWHFQLGKYVSGTVARSPVSFRGLTLAADALVFADCARQAGLRFSRGTPTEGSALVPWSIHT